MSLSCGLVGLPNVGKSTFFNAILKKSLAAAENYPFCTIEPNVGCVPVEDTRLNKLAEFSGSEKIIPALLTCVDIAGLVQGAYKGEGLGNQFLGHIRECDLIIHVLRCFDDDDIIHVSGSVDPKRDFDVISMELQFSDMDRLEKMLQQRKLDAKFQDWALEAKNHLSSNYFLNSRAWDPEIVLFFNQQGLLTHKKMLVVANMKNQSDEKYLESIKYLNPLKIFASFEFMLIDLPHDERDDLLQQIGQEQSGLNLVLQKAYYELGLISFFTTGKAETRAWKVKSGATMQEAAGVIHTDFYKGFISADVVKYSNFVDCGSWNGAKEKGLIRTCAKNAIVEDGDICIFKTYNSK